ncbi:MAG: glycosyltransferase family 2 protein [Candidatus Woesearchaeota archaeon]
MENYTEELFNLKKGVTISCIIPAYNEASRISAVLSVVNDFPVFDEVIVVNDGSQDMTSEVTKKFDNITLIEHLKNKGKTAAILTGIKQAEGELIVILDADLIGLNYENISKMIYLVLSKEYDLTILDRAGDRSAIWGWTNCARFFGGERCFWKKDLLEITLPDDGGYLLEIIMNLHYINHNKKIRNIYCDNLFTVHQYNKVGKIKGYYSYFNMSFKIVKKATIPGFLKQMKAIEEDHKYFIEYSQLIEKISFKRYKNLAEKLRILSRISDLHFKFNFNFNFNIYSKIKGKLTSNVTWREFYDKYVPEMSFEDFKSYSYGKYSHFKDKVHTKSQNVLDYFNRD